MDRFLDDLFAKRASTREEALSSIINGLNINYRHPFAEKNFATLLYRFLNSFKKGSTKEIVLASRALGMLAITIGCGDNAHELYKESLPLISKALKSKTESLLLSALDCLAIITFVGANDVDETEASMQIIWEFIHSNIGENVVVKKHSPLIHSAAVSAWSFLLTTIDCWSLSHNYWKGAISYLLDILQDDERSVCMAAGEALALICEVGIEKFACNNINDECSLNDKGKNILSKNLSLQELQEIVSNHAKRFLNQSALESEATRTLNGWNNFSLNILEVIEGGCFDEIALKIGKHSLQLQSFSQLLQVNFIKRFLGRGFVLHMLENEFLRDVFNFTPRKQISGDEPEREEVTLQVFVPERRQKESEDDWDGRTRRTNVTAFRKAKTQLLNKQRDLKGEGLGLNHD